MLYLTGAPKPFQYSGLAVLLFQLCLFIWALPPFQMGIWLRTEPIVFALFATTILSSAWMALGMSRKWIKMQSPLHPVWLCLLAWAGWQMLATLCATSPWRSWFGPPQTGDGTALSLVMLITAMQASLLWQQAAFRRIIAITAVFASLLLTALHIIYHRVLEDLFIPDSMAPMEWPDYLPFIGGYLWITLLAAGYITSTTRYITLTIFMAVILFASSNRSAHALLVPAIIVSTVAYCLPLPPALRRLSERHTLWRSVFLVACALPMTMVAIGEILPTLDADKQSGFIRHLMIKDEGIGTRMVLNQVAVSTLAHEPSRWLIGDGWGRFTDDVFKYALVDGVHVFHNGRREPNWFLVDGNAYHVHSQPLEALLSLGLPGIALWYALPMLLLWYLPKPLFWSCAPMLVALVALSHLWMLLPQCIPYQALFIAAMLAVLPVQPARHKYSPFPAIACASVALVMLWTACEQWFAMRWGNTLQEALLRDRPHTDYNEDWLAEDFKRGGDRWTASAIFYSKSASSKANIGQADSNTLGWYRYFLNTAHMAAVDPSIGARTSSMQLRLQYYLFGGFEDAMFSDLRREAAKDFENAAIRMTHKAPLRDDYTSFFLINLGDYTHYDRQRQQQILTRMLLIAPDHRGALWMLGHLLTADEERAADGANMMARAVAMHVEKVFPLTDDDIKPFQ